MPQRSIELVALVCDLRQTGIGNAGGRKRRPARFGSNPQRLLVGLPCRVQAALGAFDLTEVIAAPADQIAVTGGPPFVHAR